jgi:hypothetical protein
MEPLNLSSKSSSICNSDSVFELEVSLHMSSGTYYDKISLLAISCLKMPVGLISLT